MAQPRSPPSLGQCLSHQCTQTLFTPRHMEENKRLFLPLGPVVGERTVINDCPGPQPAPPPPQAVADGSELGVGARSPRLEPFHSSSAGKLLPYTALALRHQTIRELLMQITRFPHRLQARHWAGNLPCLGLLSVSLAVTHGQPVQSGRWVTAARACHLTAGLPLPSSVNNNSYHVLKTWGLH